jgi:type II secretory pathway pseudopilin PulG
MPKFMQESAAVSHLGRPTDGFILLEVLVAMGLVASSWMALGNSYQHLILRLGQIQEQRAQIKKEVDRHELAIFATRQSNHAIHNPGK